tara:strand:+ start:305 stop:673 length:369 start_codon:yes stop_codon:yes gene_type:complete
MDARHEPTFEHSEFTPLFERVMWRKPNGDQHWTQVFAPSDEACRWDGAEWATTAVGVRNIMEPGKAAFAYCDLRVTGRKERLVPGTGGFSVGCFGMKAKITFGKGTDDEDTFDCWVIQQGAN